MGDVLRDAGKKEPATRREMIPHTVSFAERKGPEFHRAPERTSGYFPLTMVQKSATIPRML
jgi:hypothetical protein